MVLLKNGRALQLDGAVKDRGALLPCWAEKSGIGSDFFGSGALVASLGPGAPARAADAHDASHLGQRLMLVMALELMLGQCGK